MDPITVVIVDDHALLRESLRALLELGGRIKVVASAECGNTGLAAILEHRPCVALLDIEMPGRTCFDVASAIRHTTPTRIIVTSGFCRDHHIRAALDAGAAGFFTKGGHASELVEAIKTVASGGTYYSGAVADRLRTDAYPLFRSVDTKLESLTLRERDVLVQLARGLTIKEAAVTLHLSPKTVDNYAQRVMQKLDIHSRAELVRFALREQLVA